MLDVLPISIRTLAIATLAARTSRRSSKGQHSIRINDQWRVCFVWTADGATQVEIVECH